MKTIRRLYWEPTGVTRFTMMLVSVMGAVGIWARSGGNHGDMRLVFQLAPWWVWSGGLMIVALHRYWCLWRSAVCCMDCLETKPGIAVCILAIFIWATLLTSSAIADNFGLALMIVVCCLIEAWLLSRHVQHAIAKKWRKK